MRIGELEQLSGASRHTLRYYESVGLISAQRRDNNYRDYPNKTLDDLTFIQQAQGMGFSLGEIGEILQAQRQRRLDCAQGVVLVSKKLAQVEQKIADLHQLRRFLREEKARLQASVAAQQALASTPSRPFQDSESTVQTPEQLLK